MLINFCAASGKIEILEESEYSIFGTQLAISTNTATYYACLRYKMNFWVLSVYWRD